MIKIKDEVYVKDYEFLKGETVVIQVECEECGHIEEIEDGEEPWCCEECQSENIMNTTNIEENICSGCDHQFDMWDEFYENEDGEFLCESCEQNATVLSELEYEQMRPKVTHYGEKLFADTLVVEVYGKYRKSNEQIVYHFGGFKETEKAVMNDLVHVCQELVKTEEGYENVEGYEYWFAPSCLLESDWEGVSPVLKRLAQDWLLDTSTNDGTPVQIVGCKVVRYDEEGDYMDEEL